MPMKEKKVMATIQLCNSEQGMWTSLTVKC